MELQNTFKQMTRLESKEVAGFIENDLTAHGALEPLVVSVSSDVEWVSEVQKCQKFVSLKQIILHLNRKSNSEHFCD